MTDNAMSALLARTYFHKLDAFRPLDDAGREQRLYAGIPCALSRLAHTSAPAPPEGSAPLPESRFRLTLYTQPDCVLSLGDRVEVTDELGRVWHGRSSDSFRYPSHCVTVVEIGRVTSAEEREVRRA